MNQPEVLRKLVTDVSRQMKQRRPRICVVGDMILDNMIEGVPGGLHTETRVAVLDDAVSQESIGGAANIALALHRLGAEVSLFGLIGSDLHGRQLENLLDRHPFDDHLITVRGWPTPHKDWIHRRVEGQIELFQRIDYDRPTPPSAREELVGEFRARAPLDLDVVILADHDLGTIGPESLALIGLAKEMKAKVVAIPRSMVLRGQPVDAIVTNNSEMRRLAQAGETADARPLAARYARDHNVHVYLSMLEEGMMVYPAGSKGQGELMEVFPIENPQWMGVRDIATTLVAVGLALGMDPIGIGRVSNVFRYLVVAQRGNGRVLWKDAFRFLGIEQENEE